MSKTVWIKCKQVCEYNQQVTVSDSDYKLLMKVEGGDVDEMDSEFKKQYRLLERYIDSADIYDTEHEFTDISIKLDEKEEVDADDIEEQD